MVGTPRVLNEEVDRRVFEKEIIAVSNDLLSKWGVSSNSPLGTMTITTPLGEITRVGWTYIFKKNHYDWSAFMVGNGNHGDPFAISEIITGVTEYCASEDFLNKVEHSIGTLKAIHRALS